MAYSKTNPLIRMLKNLFFETKSAANEKDEGRLDETTQKLKSLTVKLDVQLRTLTAEWTRENAALVNRPATQRMFYLRTNQALKRRMMLVGRYKGMVDKCLGTISAAKDQIEFSRKLQDVNLDTATMTALQQGVSEAQMRLDKGMQQMDIMSSTIDSNLDAVDAQMGTDTLTENERREQELWDRYDTCVAAGDENGAKAAKEELDKLSEAEMATL